MLPLRRILVDYDLSMLRTIAGLWGTALEAGEARAAADELAALLLDPAVVAETVDALPGAARAVLAQLRAAGGALPVAQLNRECGEIRPMGPARRDREQPWLSPASPLEVLWYRGLIGRAFAESRPSPQEYFFIPNDLLPLLPSAEEPALPVLPGHAVAEPEDFVAAGSSIVDDVCTALAYWQNSAHDARFGREQALEPFLLLPQAQALAAHLAGQVGLLEGHPPRPDPARARPFLEAPRSDQHQRLAEAWQTDADWNDLAHVPGLALGRPHDQGQSQPNDPLVARQAVLALLGRIPSGEWWSLASFVQFIREHTPDFQRPAGDYDSWYIRDAKSGEYLRGFEHWQRVEGGLIRHLIQGPLYWLGLVDLSAGADDAADDDAAFRLTWAGRALLRGDGWPAAPPDGKLHIDPDGSLTVPRTLQPYDRFTAARFTDWERLDAARPEGPVYTYRISAGSLALAQAQGVAVRHVLAFLAKAASNPVPRRLAEALERWEQAGTEATVEPLMVLEVASEELLETLRRLPRAKPLLGRPLGPRAVAVRPRDLAKLRAALVEAGIVADFRTGT